MDNDEVKRLIDEAVAAIVKLPPETWHQNTVYFIDALTAQMAPVATQDFAANLLEDLYEALYARLYDGTLYDKVR